ncbi:MAG: hypothetical protein Q9178_004101 [Gyalolechia marmorata]
MTSSQRHARRTFDGGVARARLTILYILYLLLAAGLFGALLMYHTMWLNRCRDAVEISHTASSLVKQFGGMDGTKTVEFKTSLNNTITRVLDDKLPMVISRACVSGRSRSLHSATVANPKVCQAQMDFYAYPTLLWAYMVFALCHMSGIMIMQTKNYRPWWKTQATRIASPEKLEADSDRVLVDCTIQDSLASGLTMGYDMATLVNALLQISYWTSSNFDYFDGYDLLTIECLSFSVLLVAGALVSASWPSVEETVDFRGLRRGYWPG